MQKVQLNIFCTCITHSMNMYVSNKTVLELNRISGYCWPFLTFLEAGNLHVKVTGMLVSSVLARWVSRRPVDGYFLKKIVLFFICSLINCSFEQAL